MGLMAKKKQKIGIKTKREGNSPREKRETLGKMLGDSRKSKLKIGLKRANRAVQKY